MKQCPFHIVLVEPEIPPNTGNISRLCAGTASVLHLVEPLGFKITDSTLKRAGLDYWEHVSIHRHRDWDTFLDSEKPKSMWLFSTKAQHSLWDVKFQPGDYLVFGSETKGLPDSIRAAYADRLVRIPMPGEAVRSINLSNSAAIALYEALRQTSRSQSGS